MNYSRFVFHFRWNLFDYNVRIVLLGAYKILNFNSKLYSASQYRVTDCTLEQKSNYDTLSYHIENDV